jgi:hypothetical protein
VPFRSQWGFRLKTLLIYGKPYLLSLIETNKTMYKKGESLMWSSVCTDE